MLAPFTETGVVYMYGGFCFGMVCFDFGLDVCHEVCFFRPGVSESCEHSLSSCPRSPFLWHFDSGVEVLVWFFL